MDITELIQALDTEINRKEAELQSLREKLMAITQKDRTTINDQCLMDAVLNCPHSITHESVTLHFCQKQKEGHNALSQLRHRLAAYDHAARQQLALNDVKEHAAPAAVAAPDELRKALEQLERACDKRAALTSPDVYNAIADLPGMSIALLELDVARGQARAALANAQDGIQRAMQEDGWIQDGYLLYRLTNEPKPRNRDEISVTMVNGSRAETARTERASEILNAIRAAEVGKVSK